MFKLSYKTVFPRLEVQANWGTGGIEDWTDKTWYNYGGFLTFPTVNPILLRNQVKKAKAQYEQMQFDTKSQLNDIYYDLNKVYFGDGIVIDDDIKYEWSRIPHFYNSFYVYQYATGFSAAIALSRKIMNEGESAVEDYKEFLKGGCSKDPIDLLKIAGVDMGSKKPIEEALKVFGELLDEMEKLL